MIASQSQRHLRKLAFYAIGHDITQIQGQYEAAEKMAKMGMDDRIQLLGVELVDSLSSMGNLASGRRPSAPHHASAMVRSHTFSH